MIMMMIIMIMLTTTIIIIISMCNQMVTSEIRDKTQVKLFPNFTRIPFDYLLTSWVTNYLSN